MANQLFQYAAGYALSMHNNVPLKLDLSYYNSKTNDTQREFELDKFGITYEIASRYEIDNLFNFNYLSYAINKLMPFSRKKFYGEKILGYNKNFFNLSNNVYLRGYFQSELYFQNFKNDILKIYQINQDKISTILPMANDLSKTNSIAVHVRLGDYLNANHNEVMADFDINYYKNSISYFNNNIQGAKFYVFSDQIDLAKKLLNFDFESVFIDNKISKNSLEDFYLMQCCQHQIIANSTFSWWAAYLNKNIAKKVIAPKNWYKKEYGIPVDLYPTKWIIL